jgi:uncharacterized protein (TIGR03437 family)
MGQMIPAPSQPQSASAGTPTSPNALRAIFAGAFGSKLAASDTSTVAISQGGVVPIYSPSTTIEPGSFISIYGQNLATEFNAPPSFNFPLRLSGTSVTINGKPAYVYFVSPTQIDVQAPDDTARGTVQVVVQTPSGSATSTVTLGDFGPSFSLLDTSHVAGIIIRNDHSGTQAGGVYDILGPKGSPLGYVTVPAKAGDTVELFGIGFGPTNPAVPAGHPFSGAANIPPSSNLAVFINGTPVTPFFAGMTLAGLFQFNITIPPGLGTGDVPLTAQVGGVQTPTGVVISLQ